MRICVDDVNNGVDDGVWTDDFYGCTFKVAAITSTKFQRVLNRLNTPFRRKLEKGNMDPADSKRILCTAMAKALLLDWKGVVDADDKPVSYNEELGTKLLMNNDLVRDFIQDFSADLDNFYVEAQSDNVKN